jgi:excisionase family DNA binding protein
MLRQVKRPTLKDYLTVKDAAAFLGVTPITLRRWDRNGKLKSTRHPINRYRLYKREQLEKLLGRLTGETRLTLKNR